MNHVFPLSLQSALYLSCFYLIYGIVTLCHFMAQLWLSLILALYIFYLGHFLTFLLNCCSAAARWHAQLWKTLLEFPKLRHVQVSNVSFFQKRTRFVTPKKSPLFAYYKCNISNLCSGRIFSFEATVNPRLMRNIFLKQYELKM